MLGLDLVADANYAGFADDLALVVVVADEQMVMQNTNGCLKLIAP